MSKVSVSAWGQKSAVKVDSDQLARAFAETAWKAPPKAITRAHLLEVVGVARRLGLEALAEALAGLPVRDGYRLEKEGWPVVPTMVPSAGKREQERGGAAAAAKAAESAELSAEVMAFFGGKK